MSLEPIVLTGCTVYLSSSEKDPTMFASNAIVTDADQAHILTVETRSRTTHGLWDEVLRLTAVKPVSTTGRFLVWKGEQDGQQVRVVVRTSDAQPCVPCGKHR